MKEKIIKNDSEEHFWEIVKRIVERKQNKANEYRAENKTESLSTSLNA